MTARAPAAIALFLYKRVEHATRVIDALRANHGAGGSDLYVFCDAAKQASDRAAVDQVRQLAHAIHGFRSVQVDAASTNRGVARSIIDGLSRVFSRHERAVIIEDDIVCSPAALTYFNAMLEHFRSWPRVSAVSGFAYPRHVVPLPSNFPYDVYFTPRLNCWGWATWADHWHAVSWDPPDAEAWLAEPGRMAAFSRGGCDLPALWRLHRTGRIDSWAIQWEFDQCRRGLVTLHPRESYTRCIGLDGSGTHQIQDDSYDVGELSTARHWRMPPRLTLDRRILWGHKDRADRLMPSGRVRRLLSIPAWWVRVARRLERRRAPARPGPVS